MRVCVLRLLVLVVAVLQSPAMPAAPPEKRAPVPDAASRAAALERLNKKGDLSELQKREGPAKLAGVLLKQALETDHDDPLKFMLFQRAEKFAVEAHQPNLALECVDQTARYFQIDALAEKTSALLEAFKGANSDEHQSSHRIDQLTDEAIAADRFDLADDLAGLSERLESDSDRKQKKRQRRNEVKAIGQRYASLKTAFAELDQTPDSPQANLVVGRFKAFYKGDWRRGIPMLALGNDHRLAELALVELRSPASPAAMKDLGDQWWTLALSEAGLSKKHIQDHAIAWYRKALPGLTGLERLAVEKRLPTLSSKQADKKFPVGRPVRLTNQFSALVAGVSSKKQSTKVKQFDFDANSEDQQWRIEPLADGYFKIVHIGSSYVLAIAGGNKKDGGRSVIYAFDDTKMDHYWKFEPVGDGSFRIVNRNSERVLGIDRRSKKAGAELTQWELLTEDPADQHWQILPLDK